MAEAGPQHLNEPVLFYEEGPVAGTQDIRSNKGSARGLPRLKISSIRPPGMTSSRFLKKLLCDFRIQRHSTNGSSGGEGGNSL